MAKWALYRKGLQNGHGRKEGEREKGREGRGQYCRCRHCDAVIENTVEGAMRREREREIAKERRNEGGEAGSSDEVSLETELWGWIFA